jgi:hypothetical protein
LLNFCYDNNIWVDWTTITHPRLNGERFVGRAPKRLDTPGPKAHILTQEGQDVHAWLKTRAGKWAIDVPLVRACKQRPTDQLTSHIFLWCMAWRPCYPPSCSTGLLGSRSISQLRPYYRRKVRGHFLRCMARRPCCHRLAQRVKGYHRRKVGKVPSNTQVISCLEGSPPSLPNR